MNASCHPPSIKVTSSSAAGDHFSVICQLAALLLGVILFGILISLAINASPALKTFSWGFLTSTQWNPVTSQFGALPAIYGTLVTSIIAMLIAVPFSIGSAVLLSDLAPYRIRRPLRVVVDLMAGVPSIIFGMWGLFILAPFMSDHVQPLLAEWFGYIPILSTLFSGPPIGIGLLTAGIVLALMVIPIMTSMMTDLFATTPQVLKEAAYGTGATSWEVVNKVLIPYTRSGLIGTIMLGLGRALGETMAITFVIGNAPRISAMLFDPGTTISSAIANEFAEATGTLYPAALMELGLLLFVITFGVILCSRWVLARYSRVRA